MCQLQTWRQFASTALQVRVRRAITAEAEVEVVDTDIHIAVAEVTITGDKVKGNATSVTYTMQGTIVLLEANSADGVTNMITLPCVVTRIA